MSRIVYKDDSKILEIAKKYLYSDENHEGYERAVEIEKEWSSNKSGKDQLEVVFDIHRSEDDAEKGQRKRIYNSFTPMAFSRLAAPTLEIGRCNDFVREVVVEDDSLDKSKKDFESYYGNRSLCDYLDSNMWDFANVMPNSFFLNLWDDENECSYRHIVRAKDVVAYEYHNGHLQWLMIKETKVLEVLATGKTDYTKKILYTSNGVYEWIPVNDTTKEIEGISEWEKINVSDPSKKKVSGSELFADNDTSKKHFYEQKNLFDFGEVLAFPLGCIDDPCDDLDLGLKEALIFPSKPLFKGLKFSTSRYQTSIALYGFLKAWFAVPPCNAVSESGHIRCENGKMGEDICHSCGGNGKAHIPKSEQQVTEYEFRLPKFADKEEVFNMDSLSGFQEVPIHIMTHLRDNIEDYLRLISISVYNTNIFDRTEQSQATATEINKLYKNINNVNNIYAKCIVELWKFVIRTDAKFRQVPEEKYQFKVKVPADYKLETQQDIITHINAAEEVGIPEYTNKWKERLVSFGEDNSRELNFYKARESFRPFYDVGQDMREFLSSELPTEDPKFVLMIFFDDIFREIKCLDNFQELNLNDSFENLNPEDQKKVVSSYVDKYKDRLKSSNVEIGNLKDAIPV